MRRSTGEGKWMGWLASHSLVCACADLIRDVMHISGDDNRSGGPSFAAGLEEKVAALSSPPPTTLLCPTLQYCALPLRPRSKFPCLPGLFSAGRAILLASVPWLGTPGLVRPSSSPLCPGPGPLQLGRVGGH